MNNASLVGRLVRDPDIRYTDGGMTIASFTIAVERKFKTQDGVTADFISCKAFKQTAEFIEKYFHQGNRIGLTGSIQTGSYTNKDGQKVYTTDIMANQVEFVESKVSGDSQSNANPTNANDFVNVPDGIDEEMPFI